MLPIVYSVQDADKSRKGIVFANSYSEAVKKIEKNSSFIIDIYLTSVSGEDIELSEDAYNNILDGKPL